MIKMPKILQIYEYVDLTILNMTQNVLHTIISWWGFILGKKQYQVCLDILTINRV